jgi:hypothetical protein
MRTTVARRAGIAMMGTVALLASGCVSAPATDGGAQDATKPVRDDSAQCDLLTTEFLSKQLSTTFGEGRVLPNSSEQRVECQWTGISQIAVVKTVIDSDASSFKQTRNDSSRSLGIVTKAVIPKASKAFKVSTIGLTGMLVDGRYVQVVVGVPTATVADVKAIATEVAANSSNAGK